jgi:pimeloyl-ACP methyl ester carboxylesterase
VLVDLVQVTTRDGVRLDGMLQRAARPGAAGLDVDGWVLVHGTGGNFYSSTLFDVLGARLLEMGCAVLRVNTRGHDGISTAVTDRGGRRLGAAYEVVDDCRHDLAAWLEWLGGQVGPRIGLLGHSLGAVKAIYALAQEPHLPAVRVVAVSPPRLSYSWFCTSPEGPEFLAMYQTAEKEMTAGRPETLLEVKLPLPFAITAAGYMEKYGPEERYNYLHLLGAVGCPTLVTLGTIEAANNMAFRDAAEVVAELSKKYPRIALQTVPGADHFYTGVRPELVARVETCLREQRGG